MHIRFPFQLASGHEVAHSHREDHIQELIEELLFVSPGERVNRPDFGCPLIERVFASETDEIAATTETMVRSALQQYLGSLIQVLGVSVQYQNDQMIVTVSYRDRQTQRPATARFAKR